MTRSNLITLAALIACGLGLSACRTPTSGLVLESYPHNRITVNSKIVAARLQFVDDVIVTEADGLLRVQVTVQNVTQKDCPFEYRFRWIDGDGMKVDSPLTTWVPVSVRARERRMLQAVAPAAEAEDFILDVRFVQSSAAW